MGRDRDPFERTLTALRRRIIAGAPLQGAPLSVKALADQLSVSPTPVREALARLSGEGLVARTGTGYVGVVHDRESLAGLYDLASVLAEASLVDMMPPVDGVTSGPGLIEHLAPRARNRALMAALCKVSAQLAPFRAAELAVLGDTAHDLNLEEGSAVPAMSAAQVRRHFRRRSRRSGEILAKALGL
ncbi:GntR family transcriptional regulator [Caulobacter sp. CCH5-E12]|uniref:GntR family transcriptional regulator n=1 Tax=Caulobacter sp. CCH5-E12 TaxID=1768770 RepID=UPI000785073C|nr:GntR family transcriptional regulator [Caulobacter sp. CCH5-E12]